MWILECDIIVLCFPQQQQEHREDGNPSTKQKPQTLDALFANLKEQRMKGVSHPNYNNPPTRHKGGSWSKIPPWARK